MAKIFTIEGCIGTGKSTQARLVGEKFRTLGYKVFVMNERVWEPCKSVIDRWRETKRGEEDSYTKAIVQEFALVRAALHRVTTPHILMTHDILIWDRSYLTNCVYQVGSGMSWREILALHQELGVLRFDKAVILDCLPEIAYERAYARNLVAYNVGGGCERESKRFMISPEPIERIRLRRELYLEVARELGLRVVNSGHPTEQITDEIYEYFLE